MNAGKRGSFNSTVLPPSVDAILARRLPDVHRIAVLRANAIGDFIFALPALQSLQAAYPQAEIVLYGLSWHVDFLTGRPGPVSRVVEVPVMPGIYIGPDWKEDPQELAAFFAAQAGEKFDLALQMHGGGRHSNPFVRRLGARLTAGSKDHDAEPLDRWIPFNYFHLEWLRLLEVIQLVGALPLALEPHLPLTPADHAEVAQVLGELGLRANGGAAGRGAKYDGLPGNGASGGGTTHRSSPTGRTLGAERRLVTERPLVALHPGAGDPRRRWPPEKFAAVGDTLARAGAQVLVIGAYEESELVEAVVNAMQYPAANLHRRLSLGGLAALLSRCRVVVSNDSGPMHIARAVGTASVGIYWCGNMITAGPLSTARHRSLISWRLDCPVCGANTIHNNCEHRVSFVAEVPVDQVSSAVLELYDAENIESCHL